MTMTRTECREQLASLLKVSESRFVDVYPYKIEKLNSQTPVAVITAVGLKPAQIATQSYWPVYYFMVHVLVARGDTAAWTAQQSENQLDELVTSTLRILFDNTVVEGAWTSIEVLDQTTIFEPIIDGVTYLDETFQISVEINS